MNTLPDRCCSGEGLFGTGNFSHAGASAPRAGALNDVHPASTRELARAFRIAFASVRELQGRLKQEARLYPDRSFGDLYEQLFDMEVLRVAWSHVRRNKGAGCAHPRKDILRIEAYGVDRFLTEIASELRKEEYRPMCVRRVWIPKPPTDRRPLGVPVVKDRVVQAAVRAIIEPVFETDFLDVSFGFRPKLGPKRAVSAVRDALKDGARRVLKIDIKKYFDSVDHDLLMQFVRRRIADERVLRLIRAWLKAGIMEEGKITNPVTGTPQGGVLSPLLANIYLHELDKAVVRISSCKLVRYADDILILCFDVDPEVPRLVVLSILADLRLATNSEKSAVHEVDQGFDFLGFRFRSLREECGGRRVIHCPSDTSLDRFIQHLHERLRELRYKEGLGWRDKLRGFCESLHGWAEHVIESQSHRAGTRVAERAYALLSDLYYADTGAFLCRSTEERKVRDSIRRALLLEPTRRETTTPRTEEINGSGPATRKLPVKPRA